MMHAAVFGLSLCGFVAVCLASARQQQRLFNRPLSRSTTHAMRVAATVLFAASLGYAAHRAGWDVGLVIWFGHVSLAAAVVFVALMPFGQR
ncbi:lipopolysaccharide export LptBFGC system permease protein LptF [Paraburkholderia sp. GAS199]|uniref:DUF3325 domain-containing protein n=1 Tax=Paraburkholderia sp. GAS199 TaxID=3035126 RepID=UPI003D1EBD5B